MKKSILYLALGGITLAGLSSCETLEDNCNIQQDDLGTGEVFVSSLNHMIDVYKRIDEANKVLDTTSNAVLDGAMVEKVGDTIMIDFGPSEVPCADTKLRKGKIKAQIVGDYKTPGGIAYVTFSNYHVNGEEITGTFDAENKGPSATPLFEVSTVDFKEGEKSTVDYDLDAQWLAGFTTNDPSDDIFEVGGTLDGDDLVKTVGFAATITQPLYYNNACVNFVEKGMINVTLTDTVSGISEFGVDFIEGDGCNNLFNASVTCDVGGVQTPVVFPVPFN